MGQRPPRRDHLQRLAAGDAGRGRRLLAAVPDLGAGGDRRPARRRAAARCCRQKRPARGDLGLAGDRGARRRGRLSAADGAGAPAHHLGAFDRLHRPAAARDRDLRRAARRRAAEAGLLAVLDPRRRCRSPASRCREGGGASLAGDLLMVAAILLCGLGYAEGATLSRRLGGWQVISWALLLALPVMALVALVDPAGDLERHRRARPGPGSPMSRSSACWSASSSGIAGLALGGIAGVGQLQLLQPFFGLALAGLLLGEPVAWTMIAVTGLVVLCVAGAKRFA